MSALFTAEGKEMLQHRCEDDFIWECRACFSAGVTKRGSRAFRMIVPGCGLHEQRHNGSALQKDY